MNMDSLRTPTRQTSTYLPGFLLGETETVGYADSSRVTMSGGGATTSPKDVEMATAGTTSPQTLTTPSRPSPPYGRSNKPSVSGPPLVSLYDDFDNSISDTKENHSSNKADYAPHNQSENSEGHWVLIYGFPPSASAHVLSLFSQIGTVVEHLFPTSGNWMFVKYAARSDARKALSYDSRVINGNIMIGVRDGKNINQMRAAYPSTPTLHNSSVLNRTTGSPSNVLSPKIRTLGKPKLSLPVQTLDTSMNTTTSSPSVVSKAMDLIFGGW